MRERRTPGSAFGKSLYFSDREIDKMCLEALKASDCLPDEPEAIDIEFFVEKHFETRLDLGSDLGDQVLGWTCFGPKGEILLVGISSSLIDDESEIGTRRCRATVAHEAGHCLMHPILFMEDRTSQMFGTDRGNLDFDQRRVLCRKGDFTGQYDGRWWEVQANKAIGSFLLPSNLVQKSVAGFLEEGGSLGLATLPDANRLAAIQHVADTFEVNRKPAEIRLDKLFPRADDGLL